jgi:hypothetical protein
VQQKRDHLGNVLGSGCASGRGRTEHGQSPAKR